MVGNIICPVQFGSGGFNPDDYFDPTTHIATEANFIKLLEDGIYDSSLIGYKVQLGNSVDYNNGLWVIADVDHDSENTGQTNCYDLISVDYFYITEFGTDQNWRNSTPRKWLNNTFYGGFSSSFKARMINPKYKSGSSWYNDDKMVIPSFTEVNGGNYSDYEEGIAYPIFDGTDSCRSKDVGWWTRTQSYSYIWVVAYSGTMTTTSNYGNNYVVPLMRVQ